MNDESFNSPVTKEVDSVTVRKTSPKAGMNHALILNLAIIILIAVVIATTGNALALLGIVFLKEMPYGLLAGDMEEEETGRPIGFVQTDD